MTALTALAAVLSAVFAVPALLPGPARRRDLRRRLRRCLSDHRVSRRPGDRRRSRRTRRPPRRLPGRAWCLPLAVGLGTAAAVGGAVGLVAGAGAAAAAYRWLPRPVPAAARRAVAEEERLLRQLPLTAELLAACLGSASSPGPAAAAVAAGLDSPMRDRLAAAAAQLALGAPPEVCWEQLGATSPALAPLARCMVRTSRSGTPPAAALSGLAQAQRAAAARAAHARVRRAGVLATAPLGLCFLPAFVLIGIAPIVMGLAALFAHRI